MNKEQKFQEFLKDLETKIQDPSYDEGINFALPENPTLSQSIKYSLCQKLLILQKDNQLTDEQMAKMLNLDVKKTRQILFAHIHKFTLDELVSYAEKVIPSNQELVTASSFRNYV
ncbi:MAG: hypothetical protein mread185_000336 [Mycoplasmataceae bacterium]|nr:MAG: hypothetical protein mread185_000336 [Mycoplasmataceae bacterium]